MGAIYLDEDGKSVINQDECVECFTCYRVLRDERYPPWFVRAIRKVLSTFRLGYLAEADVCPTGAFTAPELKWPRTIRVNLQATASDEIIVDPNKWGSGRGTEEVKTNDVTGRVSEGEAGIVIELGRPNIGAHFRDIEKVMSAIIELKTSLTRIPEFLQALDEVQKEVDTVMSVGVSSRCLSDGSIPHEEWVRKTGYTLFPNGKTNLGLGRPLFRKE
jgi:ferredoxin